MRIEVKMKTLHDILEKDASIRTVLFKFYHGIGDCVSFYCNVLPALEFHFPHIKFSFLVLPDQTPLFPAVDKDEALYDLVVLVQYPCSEWDTVSTETKAERCLRVEMGLPNEIQNDIYHLPFTFGSPLVGCHFFSTSCEAVSCREDIAKGIWDSILRAGLIPIDTHFNHEGARYENHPFPFVNRSVDDPAIKPSIGLCDGLIASCSGFVGVSSGNFWLALAELMPENILYIETEFPVEKLTREPVHHMKEYDQSVVDSWLKSVKRSAGRFENV